MSNARRSQKAGLPPGSLVFVGKQRVSQPRISAIVFSEDSLQEQECATPQDCQNLIRPGQVTWINVTGLHDTSLIRQFGEMLSIHPLVQEDILNTNQRPKCEDHGSYLFMVLKMLHPPQKDQITSVEEQVSMILCPNLLITFQEVEGDVFDTIRKRIRTGSGRIRTQGPDYLAYALIDSIVDNYFAILEGFDDRIELLQQRVLVDPSPQTLQDIHNLKRALVAVRRPLWPLREAVSILQKCDNPLISSALAPYLHDVYEHTFQVLDTLESLREMIASALESYMSSVSNRMNEIMKVLTIISTIFIPLTFIAGIYGMNFENMPELTWRSGYAATLGVMALIAIGMLFFFRRKSWL